MFVLTLFATPSLIEVGASPEKGTAYIFWVVYEIESFPNTVIDGKGLTLSSREYDKWIPDIIYVLIEANIGVDEKDKIETNGYLLYAYESGGVTTLAYITPVKERAFIVKAKGTAHVSIKNMTVRYYYCRGEKVSYSESDDVWIYFTDLSKQMPVNGVWTIQMEVFDKDSPFLFSYPDIQAFISNNSFIFCRN